MNFLFLTQNKTLSLFFDLHQAMHRLSGTGVSAFYLADSSFYTRYRKSNPEIESGQYPLLKEWQILAKGRGCKPDIDKLRKWEHQLGDPFFWNAMVADRRLILGPRSTFMQDYSQRYSHEKLLAILQTTIEEMGDFFDKTKPDVVIGFICVTLGEYIAYLIARSRGIPFLNLRPTRVKNYFHAGESVHEPSLRLGEVYQRLLNNEFSSSYRLEAQSYLKLVRTNHAMYEGVLPPPSEQALSRRFLVAQIFAILKGLKGKLGRSFAEYRRENSPEFSHDSHNRGFFYPLWFESIVKPLRVASIQRRFKSRYLNPNTLAELDYAFFPLHKEPEVTLLVYGRTCVNQIEAIRLIATNLPVGMKLVVKEHPAGLGYHPFSYYKKLLDIPNIALASPSTISRELISHAKLVTIISGSVGLEAAMLGKPVLALGHISFGFLPTSMIRLAGDLNLLGMQIRELLANHRHNEKALEAYVAAVMQTSVPIDFYSVLLGRRGVYRPKGSSTNESRDCYQSQIEFLAEYLGASVKEFRSITREFPSRKLASKTV